MKNLIIYIFFTLTVVVHINVNAQTIPINNSFNQDTTLLNNYLNDTIFGISINANISLNSDTGFVRVLLTDSNNNEFLISDANILLSDSNNLSLSNYCFETCYLDTTIFRNVRIIISDATIEIFDFVLSTSYIPQFKYKQDSIFTKRNIENAVKIVDYISQSKLSWLVDTTEFSKLPYSEKKKKIGNGGDLPNLYGFDYYKGGYFSFPDAYEINEESRGNIVENFDWRNRHGANNPNSPYWDGDNDDWSGWNTKRHETQIAPDCWAFAPTYTLEALVNLYYNQHLDLNLSEQDVVSCSGGQSSIPAPTPSNPNPDPCVGGKPSLAINYIKNTGVVNESCFTYTGYCADFTPACSLKCNNPQYEFIANNAFTSYYNTEEDTKLKIIELGPINGLVKDWGHIMSLVGYSVVQAGDLIWNGDTSFSQFNEFLVDSTSPDIGKTYWIFKNSWGNWGISQTPYVYILMDISNLYLYWNTVPLSCTGSQALTEQDRTCLDLDGDGYYWWGIGSKPVTCPLCSFAERDCDDSDPLVGPYDSAFYCTPICLFDSIWTEINNDTIIDCSHYITTNIKVKSGYTLKIENNATLFIHPSSQIIVENGATLYLDNGNIKVCGNIQWEGELSIELGGELKIENESEIIINN